MFHRGSEKTQNQQPKQETTADKADANTQANTAGTALPKNWNQNAANAQSTTQGNVTMADTQATNTSDNTTTEGKTADIPTTNQGYVPNRPSYATGAQYPNYGANATGTTPTAASNTNGRQLVIGEGITMSGEIAACDHLVVQGHVEAALKGASVLDVAETGSFNGSVEIDEATIAGTFSGEITVSGRLTVKSSGKIKGTIAYGELAVDAGATLEGKLGPVKASKAKDADKTTAGTASKKTTKKADKDEGELPFAASAAE
jgi:cytoskeletal protein CcmA (bactofilin family)